MALSRDELLDRITKWRNKDAKISELVKQGVLFDNLFDYLNDTFEGEQWNEEAQDYTPEYAKHEEDVLNDLGLSWEDVSTLADYDVDDVDNPVTSKTIIDKDDDGDADVTVIKQDDGDDNDNDNEKPESDEPHDEGLAGETTPEEEAMLALASGESKPSTELAGETTLEEDLMLNPDMSPSEFSKKAAEKRGAKPGEPAPDFSNFTNDIARTLASRRW